VNNSCRAGGSDCNSKYGWNKYHDASIRIGAETVNAATLSSECRFNTGGVCRSCALANARLTQDAAVDVTSIFYVSGSCLAIKDRSCHSHHGLNAGLVPTISRIGGLFPIFIFALLLKSKLHSIGSNYNPCSAVVP